ncbi:MAG: dephospho-CoA kinase [Alphaproteobacteria bacterium]|nr:dephospho-CoA kinase [Alphaproteobacteria bacterium]MCK5556689.1 dephospho-CoA kinase [Alphaproteobacteria bacterium]
MIVIGLTGSIGMGKSTASEMLRDIGIPVHDSDATVHDLLAPNGKAVSAVGKKFPDAVKTNELGESYIDRQILGKNVFTDNQKKKTLEEILHPMVWKDSNSFIELMKKKNHQIIALDIPLLFETGLEKRVDVTLCVSAPPEIQRRRVLERPNMTSEKFDRIVAEQLSDAEKCKRAYYVVDTGKGFDDIHEQLVQIVEMLSIKNIQN